MEFEELELFTVLPHYEALHDGIIPTYISATQQIDTTPNSQLMSFTSQRQDIISISLLS